MGITKQLIREYLDELQISSRLDDDGDIVVVQSADEDFGHDVVIYIMINENRLSYLAGAPGYEPKHDLYFLANRHNTRRYTPTAWCATAVSAWSIRSFLMRKYRKSTSWRTASS